MKKMIPFSPPYIDDDVKNEILSCLNSGWITTGEKVKLFEEEISRYLDIDNVVCVNSWTSGAILTLKWFGIKPGDEVILPAYTYCATALAVIHCGATPVIVDVDENFLISTEQIKNKISEKTKAIITVDFGGMPCNYDDILNIIEEKRYLFNPENEYQKKLNRILLISDAAHSFGALYKDKPAAKFSDITIFSFHAVKNITTAEGGAICINLPHPFNNNELKNLFKLYTLNGQTKSAFEKSKAGNWKYDIVIEGFKFNMPDVCAAIGLSQLRKYNYLLQERERVYKKYNEFFSKFPYFQLPPEYNYKKSSFHLYPLRINNINEEQRNMIINFMAENGISTNVHFIPLPMLSIFQKRGFKISNFPVAYNNYSHEISLPIYPQLTDYQVEYISEKLISILKSIIND